MKVYKRTQQLRCMVCAFEAPSGKKLSNHIRSAHSLSSREYTVKHLYGGVQPMCLVCGAETRYVAFTYKRYCVNHSSVAESAAGKVGGQAQAWNKGLTKDNDERIKRQAENSRGSGNAFYGKTHSEETKKRIAASRRLPFDVVQKNVAELYPRTTFLSQPDDYKTNMSLLSLKCLDCNNVASVSYWRLTQGWKCRVCYPAASKPQIEISDVVRDLIGAEPTDDRVILSTRKVIAPLELDIWVPEKRVAIEFHGLYWHSGGKNGDNYEKEKHREKHLACIAAGIKLLQFFGDEWRDKRDICVSMIANALGVIPHRLNARDCVVERVKAPIARQFLDEMHIAGFAIGSFHYVLRHPKLGIVGALSLRKPNNRYKRHAGMFEIARMAFRKMCVVRGGASKLLAAACADVRGKCRGIVSFADLRFGRGAVYERLGFQRLDDTRINYYYTDGFNRIDRSKVTAKPGMTEIDVANELGLRQVFGSGNAVYALSM